MKASELIQGVVDDARKLDRNIYDPQAAIWHRPLDADNPALCCICFAGVWLTRHFGPHQTVDIEMPGVDPKISGTCHFLDKIREGLYFGIRHAARAAGVKNPHRIEKALHDLHMADRELSQIDLYTASDGTVQFTTENREFYNWQTFTNFLDYAEKVAAALAEKGL